MNWEFFNKEWMTSECGYSTDIYVNRWSGNGANTKMHTHDFYELVVIAGGRAGYTYDNHDYEVHAGDTFIIPPGRYHQYHDQCGIDIINFLWYPDALPLDFKMVMEMSAFRTFFELEPDSRNAFSFEHRLALNSEQLAEIEKNFRRMQHEQEVQRESGQIRMTCMLYDILILLGRYYSETDNTSNSNDLIRMEQVVEFIEKNYQYHIQREDAAKIFGRGIRTFSEAFNKSFGMSFSDYLNKIRLRHAQQMLTQTDLRIIDIALECGFCNHNYFCATFKKEYGLTPLKYRSERT